MARSPSNNRCALCPREREAASQLCRYHHMAYENLKAKYDKWCYAYGELDWSDYLKKLLELPETGTWGKDVVMMELKKYENEKA
ncbi:MAG: hypothetical protein QW815_05605 [Nitrososphaerota archaeon]